jgi:renierapurpurin 18,18'-hydroxylase
MSPETATPTTVQPAKTVHLRETGINPNHWYVVASDREVTRQPLGVELWGRAIVLYRDTQGQVQAMEDCCPHRLVKLSDGRVVGDHIECMYHGWQFDSAGACVDVPYLGDHQKLPSCRIHTYPVRELDGFIWLWPGELQPGQVLPEPMGLPLKLHRFHGHDRLSGPFFLPD